MMNVQRGRRLAAIKQMIPGLGMLVLAACAGEQVGAPLAGGGGAAGGQQLFAKVLNDIDELYIEPVSARRVAVAGAARLTRLDNKLTVTDSFGGNGTLALGYEDRTVGFYPLPAGKDDRAWAALLETVIAGAKQASPQLAALPQAKIEQTVLNGMTGSLDRYSRYASPEVARDQRAARDGYGGIGVTLDGSNDAFRVTAVTPQGPADRAGIRPEDQIVAIDGVATKGCVHHDVIERLRGPIGSPISVQVLQSGMAQPRNLRLQRASVFEPTVTASRDGDIAVLRVHSFNHQTTQRIAQALSDARNAAGGRLSGIVLDLRSNPGGVLDQAVSLADLFLHDGPIVSVGGRHPASHQFFKATGKGIAPEVPLVVLINGGSASAAEIVAAALQDSGRAVVLGSSSYGKGTVQTVLRLPNSGELILTWAYLLSPSGYLLQQHGVVPTVCTADLGDDANSLALGLQRAAAATAIAPRATLDERSWAALRAACPGRRTRPAVELALAERLVADPKLYADALRALPASRTVQTAAAAARSTP